MTPFKIFAGSASIDLTQKITNFIQANNTDDQNKSGASTKIFSDGELWVKYNENVRGVNVFIVQSTLPPGDNIIELLMLIDAAKRASAQTITAVIPYFGYARQDRKDQPRVSITAKLMADLITTAGANRVMTMDLHTPQLQGFFNIPVDHLDGAAVFIPHLKKTIETSNLIVIAPDVGRVKTALGYSKALNADLGIVDKRRPKPNESEVVHFIGDVKGKDVLIVDDLIDTGGTLKNTIQAIADHGAKKIYAAITHPVCSGPAYDNIEASPITMLFTTNSIPSQSSPKISVIPIESFLAEAINRVATNESISSLFEGN